MSRHNSVAAHEIQHLINEVQHMDEEELRVVHGITIDENGSVVDPAYDRTFIDIAEWATYVVEESLSDIDEYTYPYNDGDYE